MTLSRGGHACRITGHVTKTGDRKYICLPGIQLQVSTHIAVFSFIILVPSSHPFLTSSPPPLLPPNCLLFAPFSFLPLPLLFSLHFLPLLSFPSSIRLLSFHQSPPFTSLSYLLSSLYLENKPSSPSSPFPPYPHSTLRTRTKNFFRDAPNGRGVTFLVLRLFVLPSPPTLSVTNIPARCQSVCVCVGVSLVGEGVSLCGGRLCGRGFSQRVVWTAVGVWA